MRATLALFALLAFGCALEDDPEDDSDPICVAGKERACVTEDERLGAQTCNTTGTAWSNCEVPTTPIGGCTNEDSRDDGTSPDCQRPEAPYCRGGECICIQGQPCAGL